MNVLITGVASGIGQAVADQFLSRGHVVYGIDRLSVAEKEGLFAFSADITDETSLHQVAQQLQKQGTHLDAIINIAGKHIMASLVEGDYQQMKQVIDINLCGTMLVNRVFHPLLREKGRIVIVTSGVAAFDPMPFNGLYNVSKTALDCYAQALRQELNLIGQTVVTIRPGAKVENCVIMNDTVVGEGAMLKNVILDKDVVVSPGTQLIGTVTNPIIIKRGERV